MLADWSAECANDDPTLVVPWQDPATGAHFVDLRTHPYDLGEILEAETSPPLARALRSLNAPRSPVLTAKCDAWALRAETHTSELNALALELVRSPEDAAFGFSSYIDILFRERAIFASAHHQQARLDQITRRAARLPHDDAALQCILRPALLAFGAALEGFAVSLYVTAIAPDEETAFRRWEAALDDITRLLRARELEPPRASATIDSVIQSASA